MFFEEAQLAEVPLPFVTINTVAPALIALGSEEHKRFFLPKIAAGELHFAIGYTETFIVDPDGVVRVRWAGQVDAITLSQLVQQQRDLYEAS